MLPDQFGYAPSLFYPKVSRPGPRTRARRSLTRSIAHRRAPARSFPYVIFRTVLSILKLTFSPRPQRLKRQCENLDLPIIAPPPISSSPFPMAPDAQENAFKRALSQADVVLDCIFGASPPVQACPSPAD